MSVVIPTFRRVDSLRTTLEYLNLLNPGPTECIVHVDAGDDITPEMLNRSFPSVKTIASETRLGPGGGRNKLIAKAANEIVLSLDDDSWPLQEDFLEHAVGLMNETPDAAVIGCRIFESDGDSSHTRGPAESVECEPITRVGGFVGCGALVRRSAFLKTSGYLALASAYGMEEADLALQLMDANWNLYHASHLHVFHACDRSSHHASPEINAAQIRNTALLAFFRYPVSVWPLGFCQTMNRVLFCLRKRRFHGIISGLFSIIPAIARHRKYRAPVAQSVIWEVRRLQQIAATRKLP